jgi:hypothetical protein
MNGVLRKLDGNWRAIPTGRRSMIRVAGVVVAAVLLAYAQDWIGGERQRVRKAIAAADSRYNQVRDAVAEIQRLRGEVVSKSSSERISQEAVLATLRGLGLELVVKNEGVDKLSLQGTGDFDRLVEGLAALQRDHKLRVLSMAASSGSTGTRVAAVLSRATP